SNNEFHGRAGVFRSAVPRAENRERSVRQRVGTDLDVHRDRRHAFAALLQPGGAVPFRRPQAPTLPAGLRIVDAGVETLGIEAERIWHPQHHHFAVDQSGEAVVLVGGRDRNVIAEADRVMLIDPGVVARLGAVVADALKTRAWILEEGPALGAMI